MKSRWLNRSSQTEIPCASTSAWQVCEMCILYEIREPACQSSESLGPCLYRLTVLSGSTHTVWVMTVCVAGWYTFFSRSANYNCVVCLLSTHPVPLPNHQRTASKTISIMHSLVPLIVVVVASFAVIGVLGQGEWLTLNGVNKISTENRWLFSKKRL